VLALAFALLLGAAACGGDSDDDAGGPSNDGGSGEGAFPVTIEHMYGQTTIEEEPERVVTVGFTDQDPLLALGVVPVAIRDWYGDQPQATWPWAHDLLDGAEPVVLPSTEIDYEQVAALEPDLIVGVSSGMTETDYDRLSQIAPTLTQTDDEPLYGETWQTGTRMIGTAVGKAAEAEELIADTEALIATHAADNPAFEGKEATVSYVFEDGSIGAYGPTDVRSRLLTSLGFVIPQVVVDAAGDQFYSQFSMEEIGKLDHDVLVWVSYLDPQVEAIKASPLRQQLDVVEAGGEVFMGEMEAGAASFSSVLSIPYALETLVPQLALAVDGDPATVVR
jgi:iron complex transport system substrate-binding protein